MPTIPSGLKPVVENYGIGAPDGVFRTDVAGGLPRSGLEWDRGVQQHRVTLILDSQKFSVWTTFFHHIIKKGALAFDMDLDSGYGVQQHSVNMMPGTYSATLTSGGRNAMWTVSFMVETESAAYAMSAADAEALLDLWELEGDGSAALLDRISIFANQDTLVLA
jgi:hypothetical protein